MAQFWQPVGLRMHENRFKVPRETAFCDNAERHMTAR
jgi:hypothetical protein